MAPTTGDVLKLVLSRQMGGRNVDDTLAAAGAAAALQPVGDVLPTVLSAEELENTSASRLLQDAILAQQRAGAPGVDLRHVLAAGADSAVPSEALQELGVTMEELHGEWRASIRRTWPNESADGWDALLSERLGIRRFELSGEVSTDAVDPTAAIPIERDLLGVRDYVTMLAT